jgi:hypothetical protein
MAAPSQIERRAIKRMPGDTIGPIRFFREPGGIPEAASVWDVSIKGIGLVTEQRLEPGTSLTIPLKTDKELPELKAHVKHARKLPPGKWLLGCDFSRFLTSDDILAMG